MTDDEALHETRLWFYDNACQCIEEAVSGQTRVNDLGRYIAWQEDAMLSALNGEGDHTFAFRQRRHFIQTGECIPLLAPPKRRPPINPPARVRARG